MKLAFELDSEEEFNKILDYLVECHDAFNIGELLSVAGEYINIEEVAKKIVATKDEEMIFYLVHYGPILDIVDGKFFKILNEYLNNN